jgi:class 3 adenylate cyclase
VKPVAGRWTPPPKRCEASTDLTLIERGQGSQLPSSISRLHVGEVLYGNVGAVDRLDFTVIGPAVNKVARIETLCEPLGRQVLVSAALAAAVADVNSLNRLVPMSSAGAGADGDFRLAALSKARLFAVASHICCADYLVSCCSRLR